MSPQVTFRTTLSLGAFVDAGVRLTRDAADYATERAGHLHGHVDVYIGTAMLADDAVILRLAHALRNATTVTVIGDTPAIIGPQLARAIGQRS